MQSTRFIVLVLALAATIGSGLPDTAQAAPKRGGNHARIEGTVLFENGSIVTGATVELVGNGGSLLTETGRRGTFSFRKLAPGSYTVTASVFVPSPPPGVFGRAVGSVQVDLDAGDRAKVVIVVHPLD